MSRAHYTVLLCCTAYNLVNIYMNLFCDYIRVHIDNCHNNVYCSFLEESKQSLAWTAHCSIHLMGVQVKFLLSFICFKSIERNLLNEILESN